jgi:hypothetical protein
MHDRRDHDRTEDGGTIRRRTAATGGGRYGTALGFHDARGRERSLRANGTLFA